MADDVKPTDPVEPGGIAPVQPLSAEARKAQSRRNMWLGLALLGFVLLVLTITLVRLYTGTGVSERM